MKNFILLQTLLIALLASSLIDANALERINIPESGGEADGVSLGADITPDGRYVVFYSYAENLLAEDTNGFPDVFLLDRDTGVIELISVDSDENQGNGNSTGGSISNDGRYVCFQSDAPNLVGGDMNANSDIFVRDRTLGTTVRVSLSTTDGELTGFHFGRISGNGIYVAFQSSDETVVPSDTNGTRDIFRRNILSGETIRVSISDDEMQASGSSSSFSISDDGNLIGFVSDAENLVADDDNADSDYFVRNVSESSTVRASVTNAGGQQNGGIDEGGALSGNGQFVAFDSDSTNLVPGDTNGLTDVFVRDLVNNTTEAVSFASDSSTFVTDEDVEVRSISQDGRYVGLSSRSAQLDSRVNSTSSSHGFIRDRQTQKTTATSITDSGTFSPRISYTDSARFANSGLYVFTSDSSTLVPGDTNGQPDIFLSAFAESLAKPALSSSAAAPDNSALCASLKNKLKKLKKKGKRFKKSGKKAAAKKLKKKIKKIKKQLKALGC